MNPPKRVKKKLKKQKEKKHMLPISRVSKHISLSVPQKLFYFFSGLKLLGYFITDNIRMYISDAGIIFQLISNGLELSGYFIVHNEFFFQMGFSCVIILLGRFSVQFS